MKLIYLSGPISSHNEIGVYKNVIKAAEIGAILRRKNYSVIIPHTASMFHQSALNHEEWMRQDLKQLSVCDEMMILEDWGQSLGCIEEVKFANENHIPIHGVALNLDQCDVCLLDYRMLK